ncbi:MAG TPA: 1-phosphofructokinase family hexose kinase [Chitinophagaceae bacterium]|nr:1-phosphofructokinase family hexose kinase [Chitinophagaceae bacterium]
MPKILTVTFSPCIDKSTSVAALIPEKKLKCRPPVYEPGGGGINVARAIHKLGGNATAIYPAGGYTGKFFNELLSHEGVPAVVIETKSHTRENLVVLDESTNLQYRFGMPGSPLTGTEWQQCLETIENSTDTEFIIASGSLPPGVPVSIFAQLAGIAKRKKAKFIADTSGEALKEAAKAGVYLLKPNLGELSSLADKNEIPVESVEEIAGQIVRDGYCEVLVVSLGAGGAILVTKDKIYHSIPPLVKRLSTVGAGDSMVAGLIMALAAGKQMQEVLDYGVACGTAATMNPATGLCKLEDVLQLYRRMRGPVD